MTDYANITLDIDARGVATLALARPQRRNAMTGEMLDELGRAAAALEGASDVRCVVLTGTGAMFCSGGDLSGMRQNIDGDREGRIREARRLARALVALNDLGKPVVGRINGGALGGGLGLVAVCDVAVTSEDAEFGFTETRLGLVPATIGPFVVARMGETKARRVFMSGRVFKGVEAATLDLVARAVPADALDAAVEAEVAPYLKVAPGAVAAAKRLVRKLGAPFDKARLEMAMGVLADAWEGEEALHGIESFLAKRPPRWA
jgi:methylglutaconyl-CoA hydratase